MNAFLHGFGGSGAVIFRVYGYASEAALLAAVPARNTVGIIGEIAGWRIVDKLPDTYDAGVAYILIGSAGTAELTAGNIRLHPVEVWQDGNALDGWIYQDGWVQFAQAWDKYYFCAGEQYTDITGGWAQVGEGGDVSVGVTLKVESSNSAVPAVAGTNNMVDLTNVSTLFFDSPGGSGGKAYGAYLQICTDSAVIKQKNFTAAGQGSLDVSDLSGKYYLRLFTRGGGSGNGYGDIRAIWRD